MPVKLPFYALLDSSCCCCSQPLGSDSYTSFASLRIFIFNNQICTPCIIHHFSNKSLFIKEVNFRIISDFTHVGTTMSNFQPSSTNGFGSSFSSFTCFFYIIFNGIVLNTLKNTREALNCKLINIMFVENVYTVSVNGD